MSFQHIIQTTKGQGPRSFNQNYHRYPYGSSKLPREIMLNSYFPSNLINSKQLHEKQEMHTPKFDTMQESYKAYPIIKIKNCFKFQHAMSLRSSNNSLLDENIRYSACRI